MVLLLLLLLVVVDIEQHIMVELLHARELREQHAVVSAELLVLVHRREQEAHVLTTNTTTSI